VFPPPPTHTHTHTHRYFWLENRLIALALYAVQGGTADVPAAFSSSSLAINNSSQPPFVFLGTTTSFFLHFTYSTAARLRAVTETTVVTGMLTSISLTGAAYNDDMAKLWIIRAPVSGLQVELVFTTMDTQASGDFVTVYDGVSGRLSSVLRVAGSPIILPNTTTTSTSMTVLFTSDFSVSNAQGLQGFAADFSFVTRVNETGNISCIGACYAANVRYKWSVK
jgi:hypothetical protein